MRVRLSNANLAALLLVIAACSTTSTTTSVTRAPWISFKGARTVALQVDATCDVVREGPDKVESTAMETEAGGGIFKAKVSTVDWRREQSACEDPPDGPSFATWLRSQVLAQLTRHGYQVVDGAADRTLTISANITRNYWVLPHDTIKDDAQYKGCERACGTGTCDRYKVGGALKLRSTFTGQPFSGRYQKVERTYDFTAVRPAGNASDASGVEHHAMLRYVCSSSDVPGLFGSGNFSWIGAANQLQSWLATGLGPMFGAHTEAYKAVLMKVDDAPSNAAGLERAQTHNWAEALKAFLAAKDEVEANPKKDAEQQCRVRHNVAVALMELGRLDEADKVASEAFEIQKIDDTGELVREVRDRRWDLERM